MSQEDYYRRRKAEEAKHPLLARKPLHMWGSAVDRPKRRFTREELIESIESLVSKVQDPEYNTILRSKVITLIYKEFGDPRDETKI